MKFEDLIEEIGGANEGAKYDFEREELVIFNQDGYDVTTISKDRLIPLSKLLQRNMNKKVEK